MDFFSRYLDSEGNGNGAKNAVGDFSNTPVIFRIVNNAGNLKLNELVVTVAYQPRGVPYSPNQYGQLPPLEKGVVLGLIETTPPRVVDLTDGTPMRVNADWLKLGVIQEIQTPELETKEMHLVYRWQFPTPITLNPNEVFGVVLNDDFRSLTQHYFRINGQTP